MNRLEEAIALLEEIRFLQRESPAHPQNSKLRKALEIFKAEAPRIEAQMNKPRACDMDEINGLKARISELEGDPKSMDARRDAAETAFRRDIAKERERHAILCVEKQFIPKGARLVECYETERGFFIIGDPNGAQDHNCDSMGCTTVCHVTHRLSKAEAPRIAELEAENVRLRALIPESHPKWREMGPKEFPNGGLGDEALYVGGWLVAALLGSFQVCRTKLRYRTRRPLSETLKPS